MPSNNSIENREIAVQRAATLRLREALHGVDPSRPADSEAAVLQFIKQRRVALLMGGHEIANLPDAIVGRRIRGPWTAAPEAGMIYQLLTGLDDRKISVVHLVGGK